MRVFLRSKIFFAIVFSIRILAPLQAETLPFRRAVELALRHSGTLAIAGADQARAYQSLQEARDLFLPQVAVGSGLAKSFGFPLSIEGSAPTIINLGSQEFLYNPAQREFIRAARTELQASDFQIQDRKNQVILETALVYTELDTLTATLNLLQQQGEAAGRAEQIVSQRVREGIDSEVELTKARLASARARMNVAQVEGSLDILRARLSQLTGLPAESLQTLSESIPKLPEVNQDADLAHQAVENSPAIKVANENAISKAFSAKGEHKMNYPAVDFVAQYGLFAKFNNFQDFFRKFQRNNGVIGVAIRFPFLNLSQRARAQAADAEAVAAQKQAEGLKEQVSSEALKLQRSVRQLAAAKEVARLEQVLAQSDVQAAQTRVQAGTATLKDEETARIHESETYIGLLDASFALDKAQIQLLRATGDLQSWATAP